MPDRHSMCLRVCGLIRTAIPRRYQRDGTKWFRRFEDAMIGFHFTSVKGQRALLLHYGVEDLEDIFDTLDNTGSADEIKPAIDALKDYFTPKKNTVYEAIVFRDAVQETHETADQFCTRLRKLAENVILQILIRKYTLK